MNNPNSSNPIIDIIAPAGKIKNPAALAVLEKKLLRWGFQPRIGPYLLTDRFKDLMHALYAADSNIIWCFRGGHGSAELLSLLAEHAPPHKTKTFIGFSDISALHLFLYQHWGWRPLHAPCAGQLITNKIDARSKQFMKNILTKQVNTVVLHNLVSLNSLAEQSVSITSSITGGNLATINHLIGTPYQINTQNKIMFFEDVNEPAYKIRRMLVQFHQANLLKKIKALLFGTFLQKNPQEKIAIAKELREFASAQPYPVFQTDALGHGKTNYPIGIGSTATWQRGELCINLY